MSQLPKQSTPFPPANRKLVFDDEGKALYYRERLLGQGTYGVVWKARAIETNEAVVIKETKRMQDAQGGMQPTELREASILAHLDSPFVVAAKDFFRTRQQRFCLVFEFCRMDLAQYLEQRACGRKRARRWARQMIAGLSHMHSRRILHRDLKPANILVSADGQHLKIADFGLGREHFVPIQGLTPHDQVVTLWYRPPELLLGARRYGTKVDVWSLGLVIAEMARAKPLFCGSCDYEMLQSIFAFCGTPSEQAMRLICPSSGPGRPKHGNSRVAKRRRSRRGWAACDKTRWLATCSRCVSLVFLPVFEPFDARRARK